MKTPYVSIIIPTTNRNDQILQSFRSILNDKYFNDYEIIIVNDSCNELRHRIMAETKKFTNVKIIRSNSRSASGARSKGAESARGKYITFLDDDDFLGPDRISQMFDFAETHTAKSYSFISTQRAVTNRDMNFISVPEKQLQGTVNLDDILYINDIDIGILIKNDLYRAIGGFDQNFAALEDWDLVIRLLLNSPGYKMKNAKYFVVDEPISSRVSTNQEQTRLQIADKYKNIIGEKWYRRFVTLALYHQKKLTLDYAIKNTIKDKSSFTFILYTKLLIKKKLDKN